MEAESGLTDGKTGGLGWMEADSATRIPWAAPSALCDSSQRALELSASEPTSPAQRSRDVLPV